MAFSQSLVQASIELLRKRTKLYISFWILQFSSFLEKERISIWRSTLRASTSKLVQKVIEKHEGTVKFYELKEASALWLQAIEGAGEREAVGGLCPILFKKDFLFE